MSLINDALKRASEAQVQSADPSSAAARPRGPKGVDDLPVPMTPVATANRAAWLPVAGVALLILTLLTASGFFFWKWWEERRAWVPYEETPEDPVPDKTNAPPVRVVKVVPPTVVRTNPPAVTPPTPAPPKPVPPVVVPPPKVAVVTPAPPLTNSPVPTVTTPTNPPPPTPVPPLPPVVKVAVNTVTNPPPPPPPTIRVPPKIAPPPPKKTSPSASKVADVQFPELKLQGIIRRKKGTSALVNGKTLTMGDRVEGAILLKIESESVIFEKLGAQREIFLLR